MRRIGVLAVQGGFAAHARALTDLGLAVAEVRDARSLEHLDGLVLPGGESTVHLKQINRLAMRGSLEAFVGSGKPIVVTCAGLIIAARQVENPDQESFGWIDVTAHRNAWGAQVDSFEAVDDTGSASLVFIRAPRISRIGAGVETVLSFRGEPVMVRQGNVTGATFHPEIYSPINSELAGRARELLYHDFLVAPLRKAFGLTHESQEFRSEA